MADTEPPALETPTDELKRAVTDDSIFCENVGSTKANPSTDGIVHAAKKLRPDNTEEDKDVDHVFAEPAEEESSDNNNQAETVTEATEKTEQGDISKEYHTTDDAAAKDLSDRDDDDTDDGDDVDEDVERVEKDDGPSDHPKEVKLGPKVFTSSADMLNFFYDLLRGWPLNFNLNKYEYMMLEDLISKGHQDPQRKIGAGIEAFQVRVNPEFYSRCYYVIRKDGSFEDFSYRKCVNKLMPLPDNMKLPHGNMKKGCKTQGGKKRKHLKTRGGKSGYGRGNQGHGNRKKF